MVNVSAFTGKADMNKKPTAATTHNTIDLKFIFDVPYFPFEFYSDYLF